LDQLLLDNDAEFKHYRLRIVGHSLGAGASSLVALFLRAKFPGVKAIVYEPPGCTMSLNLAEESEEWCTSFVTGMDAIPRSTSESFDDLRNEVLLNLARIKTPKHVLMTNRNIDSAGVDRVLEFVEEALYPPDNVPDTPFLQSVMKFMDYCKTRQEKSNSVRLHIPGKIVHLASESFSPEEGKKFENEEITKKYDPYKTCWAKREDFRYIVLSRHFLMDHLTDTINAAFHGRMKRLGMTQPYNEVVEAAKK
jgi:sn1-specific diacylglycerol lipase